VTQHDAACADLLCDSHGKIKETSHWKVEFNIKEWEIQKQKERAKQEAHGERQKGQSERQKGQSERQKGQSERQPTHETEEGQVGDDGLHHLTPSIPPGLVAITLTDAVTVVIISIRQVTKQEYSLRIVILQQVYSQARSEGKGLMKHSLVAWTSKGKLTQQSILCIDAQ